MYASKDIKEALSAEVTVASVVANHLGLKSNFFSHNKNSTILNETFELFKIEGIVHLRLPTKLRKYITEYHAVVLLSEDDELDFDYVVQLNANNKIGFWK
jgi:hypothetical protein